MLLLRVVLATNYSQPIIPDTHKQLKLGHIFPEEKKKKKNPSDAEWCSEASELDLEPTVQFFPLLYFLRCWTVFSLVLFFFFIGLFHSSLSLNNMKVSEKPHTVIIR